jgi:hypothetical protein
MDCLGSVSILFNLPSTYIQGLPSPLAFPHEAARNTAVKGSSIGNVEEPSGSGCLVPDWPHVRSNGARTRLGLS